MKIKKILRNIKVSIVPCKQIFFYLFEIYTYKARAILRYQFSEVYY